MPDTRMSTSFAPYSSASSPVPDTTISQFTPSAAKRLFALCLDQKCKAICSIHCFLTTAVCDAKCEFNLDAFQTAVQSNRLFAINTASLIGYRTCDANIRNIGNKRSAVALHRGISQQRVLGVQLLLLYYERMRLRSGHQPSGYSILAPIIQLELAHEAGCGGCVTCLASTFTPCQRSFHKDV